MRQWFEDGIDFLISWYGRPNMIIYEFMQIPRAHFACLRNIFAVTGKSRPRTIPCRIGLAFSRPLSTLLVPREQMRKRKRKIKVVLSPLEKTRLQPLFCKHFLLVRIIIIITTSAERFSVDMSPVRLKPNTQHTSLGRRDFWWHNTYRKMSQEQIPNAQFDKK